MGRVPMEGVVPGLGSPWGTPHSVGTNHCLFSGSLVYFPGHTLCSRVGEPRLRGNPHQVPLLVAPKF
jgi:hypothetical protein